MIIDCSTHKEQRSWTTLKYNSNHLHYITSTSITNLFSKDMEIDTIQFKSLTMQEKKYIVLKKVYIYMVKNLVIKPKLP